MTIQDKAATLKSLYESSTILRVVNVWDAISTKAVADLPGTTAIATAGHSIAASHGFEDGTIGLDRMLEAVAEIVAATELPVTADLDDGYEDPAETVRRAIAVGVVGANVEDRLRPFDESVARVRALIQAAAAEGVDFQLNARTDAIARAGDRPIDESIADAIERGKAFLGEGAAAVFVPGLLNQEITEKLVAGLGEGKLSVIGLPLPGVLAAGEYEKLGVSRISYGPIPQRVALRALQELATDLYGTGIIPLDTPALN
jgi:2-methylisocitrate lyase-like PEP mutase family enzyme